MKQDKSTDFICTQAKRYPAEGKGLDYSTALPFDQQTGQEPQDIAQPGRPTVIFGDSRPMRYQSTTNGERGRKQ